MGYVLRATICGAEERYDKALPEWTRAVELEPGNPVIHALHAGTLARLGKGTEAMRAARTGYEMSSGKYPENFLALGMAYWAQGKHTQAATELGRAIQTGLAGTVAEALEIRARCYIALKQYPMAAQDLHKAFAIMPNDPRLHDVAAIYYRATKDPRVTQFETKAKELRQKVVRVIEN
jgi:Flp pilus assembly protein TadD